MQIVFQCKILYYSTVMSFHLISEIENAKYASVLHSRLLYYVHLTYPGFKTQAIINTNKNFSSQIINPLFDGSTDNMCGYFTSCAVFFRAPQGQKKQAMSKMSAHIIC